MDPRFRAQLRLQLRFLERSCSAFDAGYTDEATRIAVVIRVLIHDTRASTSLLGHLNARSISLLSTSMDIVAHFNKQPWLPSGQLPTFFNGMGVFDGTGHHPKLANAWIREFRPVDAWWQQPVIVLEHVPYTRASITLAVANKDGGAHVDANLTAEYERLIAPGSLGTLVRRDSAGMEHAMPIADAHFCALRQMGYELLNSPELVVLADDPPLDPSAPAT